MHINIHNLNLAVCVGVVYIESKIFIKSNGYRYL